MIDYSKLFYVSCAFGLLTLGITTALGGNPMIWVPIVVALYLFIAFGIS